jgi:hypothetical protein
MPEIQRIDIGTVSVPRIESGQAIPPPTLPAEPPITLMLGFPVADMPSGEIPHYEPLDFTPGEHTHQTTKPPKPAEEKPADGSSQPAGVSPLPSDVLDIPKVAVELPCPPADAIPLGAKNKSQTAIIIGYEMVDGTCEPQLKPLDVPTIVGNYLPGAPVVATTAAIAAVATTAAIVVQPLGDFLLKAIRPTVKRVIKKINEKLQREVVEVRSVRERQELQRSLRN